MNRPAIVITILALFLCASSANAQNLEESLRTEYQKKAFFLRSFYQGAELKYDRKGALIGPGKTGPWTLGRVQVDSMKLSPGALRIEGHRAAEHYDSKKQRFEIVRLKEKIRIELQRSDDPQQLTAALQRVFLHNSAELVSALPPYWLPYMNGTARHAAEVAAQLPAVDPTSPNTVKLARPWNPSEVLKVGGDVKAPKVTYAPDPEYDEFAKQAHVEGMVRFRVIVDEQGLPRDIEITQPIGFGLDEKALEAISTWRFEPAKRGDQPVKVQINIEVNFRLY
jgi:TonB family protein